MKSTFLSFGTDISTVIIILMVILCITVGNLSSECSHYVIPDGPSLANYAEIFQHPSLVGIIVTATASLHVQYYILMHHLNDDINVGSNKQGAKNSKTAGECYKSVFQV